MTRVFNDPAEFARDAVRGMAAAGARYIRPVHGGVVRAAPTPVGEVALVVGGGAGHYPAFAGWVGPGMAHGAACGNVFASPSASQVHSVATAADTGAGILLAFGNYAGDVLNFGQAARQLRAEGRDVRVVTISDDVASNTPENYRDRRGIAGDLPVLKITGAAIASGASLDESERVAWKANDATRSIGIAFTGCTLPGADAPLFEVPAGQMSLGMGVHGEPGVREVPQGSASQVADLLFDAVLAEQPARSPDGYGGRVAAILNGLGAVKYEELYAVYGRVDERLQEAGLTPVLPEVGEFMTSLNMAGLSLTLVYLDEELERHWLAPVDTPAFRRGASAAAAGPVSPGELSGPGGTATLQSAALHAATPAVAAGRAPSSPGSPESQEMAEAILAALRLMRDVASARQGEWGRLDAVAGDGDHGQGMAFGTAGAVAAAEAARAAGAGARTVLERAGAGWAEAAGGTAGALWGAALTAAGATLSDQSGADAQAAVAAALAGAAAIREFGGAVPGDKTMVDALVPFVAVLERASSEGLPPAKAWQLAAAAATQGAAATAQIVARRGRSRVLGVKSLGTPDPGATSLAELTAAIANYIAASAAGLE